MRPNKFTLPVLAALLLARLHAAESKPDIVLSLADDLRDTVGCYGHPNHQSPSQGPVVATEILSIPRTAAIRQPVNL